MLHPREKSRNRECLPPLESKVPLYLNGFQSCPIRACCATWGSSNCKPNNDAIERGLCRGRETERQAWVHLRGRFSCQSTKPTHNQTPVRQPLRCEAEWRQQPTPAWVHEIDRSWEEMRVWPPLALLSVENLVP